MSAWTPNKLQAARQMWEEQHASAGTIAAALDLTRNQVIGVARRQGWAKHPPSNQFHSGALCARKPRLRLGHRRASGEVQAELRQLLDPDLAAIKDLPPLPRQHRMVGPIRECSYPHGDAPPYRFCGEKTLPGSSYCGDHHRLTHSKVSVNAPEH